MKITAPMAALGLGLLSSIALSAAPGGSGAPSSASTGLHRDTEAQPEMAIGVNGVPVSRVSVDGRFVSLRTYEERIVPAVARSGGVMHLVVDRSAAPRRYLVAFRTERAANAYMAEHGMGQLLSPSDAANLSTVRHQPGLDGVAHPLDLGGRHLELSTCSLPTHLARVYDGTSCTSSYFSVLWGEYDANLGNYGWNDRISSLAIGDCISNLQVWVNINKGGSTTNFGGPDVYTTMPIGFNNTVSSLQADDNHICPPR